MFLKKTAKKKKKLQCFDQLRCGESYWHWHCGMCAFETGDALQYSAALKADY